MSINILCCFICFTTNICIFYNMQDDHLDCTWKSTYLIYKCNEMPTSQERDYKNSRASKGKKYGRLNVHTFI